MLSRKSAEWANCLQYKFTSRLEVAHDQKIAHIDVDVDRCTASQDRFTFYQTGACYATVKDVSTKP